MSLESLKHEPGLAECKRLSYQDQDDVHATAAKRCDKRVAHTAGCGAAKSGRRPISDSPGVKLAQHSCNQRSILEPELHTGLCGER